MLDLGVCLEMFFTDNPFLERIALAGKAGFKNAEMWFIDGTFNGKDCSLDPKSPDEVRKAAEKAGVRITNAVIGAPDGSLGGGLARAEENLSFCSKSGVGAAIVCTGNIVPGMSREDMMKSVLEGLKETVKVADKHKVNLLLEPLNDKVDHPDYLLTSSDEGAELCRKVASPRMKLLFDCYHMQIMEGDLCGHIKKNLDVIGHLHSAGHPGRHELWNGETNYPFVVGKLEELGYKGVFSLEYMPELEPSESASPKPCATWAHRAEASSLRQFIAGACRNISASPFCWLRGRCLWLSGGS